MPPMNEPPDTYTAKFQEANCRGCRFADKATVCTGEPCCTIGLPDIRDDKCYTRRVEE
ncbi:hypothetical protein LCGC14_1021020 [marine sediment metagenome]|uniref:Uncharacterized protein n=1 Tax=marine sediment metagenome TaxID=412755 RepID=A0A0F9N1Y7_9ZZZZ